METAELAAAELTVVGRRLPPPPPAVERRSGPRRIAPAAVAVALVVFLLAQMAFTMTMTAREQSATADEPVYIGAAVAYVRDHSLRYNVEHPPLAKELIAIGMVAGGVRPAPAAADRQRDFGAGVLYDAGNSTGHVLLFARLPIIVLTLLFGLVVFFFARDLTGTAGGLLALAVYAFTPDIIAHGSLATLDVPSAGFLLTAAWMLWRGRERPWLYLPLAGAAVGAALAVKMNVLVAVPLVAVLAGWTYLRRQRSRLPTALVMVVIVALIAVVVVWLTYLAVDPRLRSDTPQRIPEFHGVKSLVFDLLPFPESFRDGMRYQIGLEGREYGGFLLGERYEGSHWYYLPVALLIKEPIGALLLWLGGVVALCTVRRLRPAVLNLVVPAGLLLGASMFGSRDFGARYAMVVPVFGAVVAAAVVALRPRWTRVVAAVLVAFVAVSSVRTYPFYLPYSNEAFGGTANTYRLLHDSNVDWGQDMRRTAEWLNERYPGEKVWMLYHGGGRASAYGIDAADPLKVPADRVHGLLVVSNFNFEEPGARVRALLAGTTRLGEVGHTTTILRR